MLTFFNLLKINEIEPSSVRLVRHGNKQLNVLEVYKNDIEKFVTYSAWQKPEKYKNSKYLAFFCPDRGTTSLFLGIWKISGVTINKELEPKHLKILKKHNLPLRWFDSSDYYHLEATDTLNELKERLVIDWGRATVSWVQTKNKPIVQIKPPNSIGDFISFDDVQLDYEALQKLAQDSDSNFTWVNALRSVNGIYLIQDKSDGSLYVGSAYGKDGIWGRWQNYAKNGHGGNKLLKPLNPASFEFSILEIAPTTISADEVIERENRWKVRLGTRDFGLNDN